MSQAGASLLLVAVLFGLAGYMLIWPPEALAENLAHRAAIPFVLVATAYGVLENLRTRAHMGQLIGAIRGLVGKSPPTAAAKAEAVEILLQSLKSGQERVRRTAAEQLRNLTGQDLGEDFAAWSAWWASNKGTFGKTAP